MKWKVGISLFLTLLIFSFVADAMPINIDEASVYADKFYKINKLTDGHIKDMRLIKYQEIDAIAVFSYSEGGFVAISLDNIYTPVVAYSLSGNIELNDLPESAIAWLNNISENIYLKISKSKSNNPIHSQWQVLLEEQTFQQKAGSVLLSTAEWGQGCFYNSMCPGDNNGPCAHAVTGCTATAMAEILKFWEYPTFGTGSHSYNSQWYGTLTANFGETEYLWDQMPDVPPTEENEPLATLMYHCGVSVNMGYTGTTSGAAINPSAFVNYFGFSPNAYYEYKTDYSWTEWVELLKAQLDNGYPVLYAGWDSMLLMGHAFVCDGYDAMDYLHFNWGDNGDGNGYFMMPEIVFSSNNIIVCNLFPRPDCDISVTNIIEPISRTFVAPVDIQIAVRNMGALPVTDVDVCYSVNGGTPICETLVGTINPDQEVQFVFQQKYDFSSSPGDYFNLNAYANYVGDLIHYNDTAYKEILNVACASVPYSTSFGVGEGRDGWLFDEDEIDENLWQFQDYDGGAAFYQANSNNASDWLFSRCIELEEGNLYKLVFDYKSTGLYWPQNLEVYYGTSPDIDYMTNLLTELNGFTNDLFTQSANYFTVESTDSWYFGFKCASQPDMLAVTIDNFGVSKLEGKDLAITEILSPDSGCDLAQEVVQVEIRNMCSTTLSNFYICYKADDNVPVVFTYNASLAPGSIYTHTFSIPADFSIQGEHILTAYIILEDDSNSDNDTLFMSLNNVGSASAPYLCGFDTPEEYQYWTIENTNADNRSWNIIDFGGTSGGCARYEYQDFNAADDWIFTKCFYLDGAWTYSLTFNTKIEDAQWPEKLNVYLLDFPSSNAESILLGDFPNLTNSEWGEKTVYFEGSQGYKYIGFHCYSDVQMFNLYLDDVEILEYSNLEIIENEFVSVEIFPNPAKDVLNLVFTDSDFVSGNIYITDLSGKVLLNIQTSEVLTTIDISNLSGGVYFVRTLTNEGEIVKKFTKF